MSMQPPWPGQPEQGPEAHSANSQPPNGGWQQAQNGQPQHGQPAPGQQYGQALQPQQYGQQPPPQPEYAQPAPGQQYAQPQQYGQQYPQPYFGAPGGMPPGGMPAPKKNTALPWILAGGGVVVLAMMVGVVLAVSALLGGGNKANMVASPTTSASFEYPDGWIENGKNVTIIKDDGRQPAERFSAINKEKQATALVVYDATDRPDGAVTSEKIRAAIDQGFQSQLDASQEDLIYYRSTSGFGCVENFNYTDKPTIVDRDGMYGYSYGYTCQSYKGNIEGEYFVAYDDEGVAHRMTVEALQSEWDSNKATLTAIIPSLQPNL